MAKKRWSASVGPHGARVRVEERSCGGNVQLVTWDAEKRQNRTESLGFKVRDADGKLMQEATKAAKKRASLRSNEIIAGELPQDQNARDVTVGELFGQFKREVLPTLEGKYHEETKRSLRMWERVLGSQKQVALVGESDWRVFERARRSGRLDARGLDVPEDDRRRVGPRTVEKDLKVLRQVCAYGANKRIAPTEYLLRNDPTRGLSLPSEANPARPVATDAELAAMLDAAERVTTRRGKRAVRAPIAEFLTLAALTGRRITPILALRWSDWRLDEGPHGSIRWRDDSDKLGSEWWTPVHPNVRETLEGWRAESPGLGEAWIFSAPASDGHVSVDLARAWFRRAEEAAKIPHRRGYGFHAFRRMWATKRKHLPAKDVAAVGGWKDTATLEKIYQLPDPDTIADVVLADRALRGSA